jgi:glutathione S-transferase
LGAGRTFFALSDSSLPARKEHAGTCGARKVHPLGKSPVIEDNGLILAESGAILEYLQETYDAEFQLKPRDPAHKVQYRFWLHYAEGSLMPLLLMKLVLQASVNRHPVWFAGAG